MRVRWGLFVGALVVGVYGCSGTPKCGEPPDPCTAEDGDSGNGGSSSGGAAAQHGSGGATSSGGAANSGAGAQSGSGSGGSSAGASGKGGGGGKNAGSGGSQGGDGGAGSATCNPACTAGKHCEVVVVQCIKAPCPAQATCVDDDASGAGCGTRGAAACADDEYCDFGTGKGCGATDAGGTCKEKPTACTKELNQVCGCDGTTYGNPCTAASAGVSIDHEGECGSAAAPTNNCDDSHIACDQGPPKCAGGQVPSVSSNLCYGDCVPVESCTCAGPDECPQPEQYTCHMSAGHCGPYV